MDDGTDQQRARSLVARHGRTFAEDAGITLLDEPDPLWQLLVLAQLVSTRISASVAVTTARVLFAEGWTSPQALRRSTWNQRVAALGRGGYRRYDLSTATRLEENARLLLERWGADLRTVRDGERPVLVALQDFSGIGPTGAAIFCREVQGVWPGTAPFIDRLVVQGAAAAALPTDAEALAALVPPADLPRLAAALVRVARKPALLDGVASPARRTG